MEKIKCVLYARYSSDNQREVSAEEQIKHCKTKLSEQIEIERKKQAQRIDIDEASVRKALSRISADICEGRPIEEYKKLFSAFVERVDVFEDYVTIVLKVFDMINVRVCNGSGVIKEEPPLDLHQMVVWNGGAEPTPSLNTITRHSLNQRYNPRFTRLQASKQF